MAESATAGESRAMISGEALLHNVRLMRAAVGAGVGLWAVVKADAYGHRADLVTSVIAPHVDGFAVATLGEAAALKPDRRPVLVMLPLEQASLTGRDEMVRELLGRPAGVSITVCGVAAVDDLARLASAAGRVARVQIMVDTGMTRGAPPQRLAELVQSIRSHPSLHLEAIYTHFARSEETGIDLTDQQMRRFHELTDKLVESCQVPATGQGSGEGSGFRVQGSETSELNPEPRTLYPPLRLLRHAANSGGTFFHPRSHLDLVRPGISLYGIDPTGAYEPSRPLRPVLKWTAPLIGLRDFARGGMVGYGQTWRAERDTRIGMIPVGYADGYPRNLSNRSVMLLHGRPAPVVGRVSMDLIALDVGGIPAARVGDEVTVMDDDPASPCSAYALADQAGTIAYELFCRIGSRVRRVLQPAGS